MTHVLVRFVPVFLQLWYAKDLFRGDDDETRASALVLQILGRLLGSILYIYGCQTALSFQSMVTGSYGNRGVALDLGIYDPEKASLSHATL
jgi:hypothetical protein